MECPAPTPLWVTVGIPIGTFVVGLLIPRFWMSKKERKDVEQANFLNSSKLVDDHENAYGRYTDALALYCSEDGDTRDNFISTLKAGDDYFRRAKLTADAIMSGKVDPWHRDNTLINHFKRLATATLPEHYEFAQAQSQRHGLPYPGKLRREDHLGIFLVVEKWG